MRSFMPLLGLLASSACAGPDLICSEILSGQTYGALGDYQSFSFGDITCNIGDEPFTYQASTPNHPVFTSGLYRIKDGRLEQIGLSFVTHTFFPLQGNACDLGCEPGAPGMLGPGCSNTVGAALAGNQADMGPRIEVNPWSGEIVYPFRTINETGHSYYKRLKAHVSDISDPDAQYFVERQYVSNEEAPEARNNNSSYRRVSFTPGTNAPQVLGDTFAGQPAIFAWRDHGLGPNMPDPDVMISSVNHADGGVIHVGSKATDLGDGSWRYDYAVQNQNMQNEFGDGLGAFFIPIGFNRTTRDPYFNDVDYLDSPDGIYLSGDWVFSNTVGRARWFAPWEPQIFFELNYIRWGSTYTFSFVSDHPPTQKFAHVGFGALSFSYIQARVVAPTSGPCRADFNADGTLDFFDVSLWLQAYQDEDYNADFVSNGVFDFFDVSAFLQEFNAGCP
ncbi:MAG: GC-type dockerin domain-anchored protein [Phycisphaerales bacterium]